MDQQPPVMSVMPVDKLLDEALALATEVREYIASSDRRADATAAPVARLTRVGELSRVTARVGHSIAWLMARRAVEAGEMSAEEALAETWRLGSRETCLARLDSGDLPPELLRLMARSAALYERIARLDDLLSTPPVPPQR